MVRSAAEAAAMPGTPPCGASTRMCAGVLVAVTLANRASLTWEDIKDLPESSGRTEILNGELILAPTPARHHQEIASNITAEVLPFVRERDLGKFYGSPVHCILEKHVNVEPDLCFVSKDRFDTFDGGVIRGAPDLVIEILSPSNRSHDTLVKFRHYERFGVREYWLVDPRERVVAVHALKQSRYELLGEFRNGQTVKTHVLDGLALDPARIF